MSDLPDPKLPAAAILPQNPQPEPTLLDVLPPSNPPASWQRQLADAIRSPAELLATLNLPVEITTSLGAAEQAAGQPFPTLVPRSFLQRMETGNRHDPLLLQVLPLQSERISEAGFVADPVGDEAARRAPGLLQKYDGRALLITSGACAVHCRYCFRREYPYGDEPRRMQDWDAAIEEITADESVSEIILSGGDPLMLSDDRLGQLCRRIDAISHVDRIRFHTRLPIVLPARVTAAFLELLTSLRAQPIVVVHANHGHEIAGDCCEALRCIVRAGIPVLNQAVLLRHINDTAAALEDLCRRLVNIGVTPYYLHQLDRVQGAAHFETDRQLGLKLIEQLSERLPGYAVPRFVEEIPGERSKTPIQ